MVSCGSGLGSSFTEALFSRVQRKGNTSTQHGYFRQDEISGLVWSVRGHFLLRNFLPFWADTTHTTGSYFHQVWSAD